MPFKQHHHVLPPVFIVFSASFRPLVPAFAQEYELVLSWNMIQPPALIHEDNTEFLTALTENANAGAFFGGAFVTCCTSWSIEPESNRDGPKLQEARPRTRIESILYVLGVTSQLPRRGYCLGTVEIETTADGPPIK